MWDLKQRIRMTRTNSTNSTRALFRSAAVIADNGVFVTTAAAGADATVTLSILRWVMPVVRLGPSHEQALLEIVGNNLQFVDIAFLTKRTNSIAVQLQLHSHGH